MGGRNRQKTEGRRGRWSSGFPGRRFAAWPGESAKSGAQLAVPRSQLVKKALLQGVPAAAAAGIKSNSSFPAACTSEMTPLAKFMATIFMKIEPSISCTACCAPLFLLFVIWSWEKEQVPENRPLCGGMKGAGGGFRRSTPLPFCRILFILHKTAAKNLTMQMLT